MKLKSSCSLQSIICLLSKLLDMNIQCKVLHIPLLYRSTQAYILSFLFVQHLHYFIQSKYDCSEAVLAQGPLKMSKPVGRMRGESIYCTPTLACTHTCIHKFRVEYMHSTWLICLWKWLLFFICFYEFQKNKNKKRVKWKVKDNIICLSYSLY